MSREPAPRACIDCGRVKSHIRMGRCWSCKYGAGLAPTPIDHAARVEDIEWMAQNGETAAGAARRLGVSVSSIEFTLRGANRLDLLRKLTGSMA